MAEPPRMPFSARARRRPRLPVDRAGAGLVAWDVGVWGAAVSPAGRTQCRCSLVGLGWPGRASPERLPDTQPPPTAREGSDPPPLQLPAGNVVPRSGAPCPGSAFDSFPLGPLLLVASSVSATSFDVPL